MKAKTPKLAVLAPPPDVVDWPEMETLADAVESTIATLRRLQGITQAGQPLCHPARTQHLRRTVTGYRKAIIRAATDILTAINDVDRSTPGVSNNGKAS